MATASVRIASPRDVPYIASMIAQLAKFERLADACVGTEEQYRSTLFNAPAFQGLTVLLLEISRSSASNAAAGDCLASQEVEIGAEIADPDKDFFTSDSGRIVAGFVLFFPNYSTFLAKPGLYIEDLFVREPYRRQGLGRILLRTVAKEAANRGLGRVEWCVLDWNENAIKFYQEMGALVLPEWRICRLTGDALKAYGT
ncbi:hypothetical protein SELMODRAFT_233690 [Selaginella moellendorffii]|uniref:N-acetyltransferase domain-containing protein n=1 Tax=Selaginella moellendorffii TaxID=88036 RepID=D8SD71_SELML|nr:L-ornithine N5-acetyltransferase NATA1 [Selaginella moellendorffii]EFJ17571.1 hypothetical protein SELMODRAFT_233690 [Selaginella moellendorffii]|eukprot:XP_002981383.1 L-ornithine N5-acetyltransferase NATA1 [Selaginella moellendorffii]